MAKNQEDIQLNFKANVSEAKRDLKTLLDTLNQYQKASDKMVKSAGNNAGSASNKSVSNFGTTLDKLTKAIQDNEHQMKELNNLYNKSRNSSKVTSAQSADMQTLVRTIVSAVSKATTVSGMTGTMGDNRTTSQGAQMYAQQMKANQRNQAQNWNFQKNAREVRSDYSLNSKEIADALARANSTMRATDGKVGQGYVTYDKNQELTGRLARSKDDIGASQANLKTIIANLGIRKENLGEQLNSNTERFKNGTQGPEETERLNTAIQKEIDVINKTTEKYNTLQSKLDKAGASLEESSSRFETGKASGGVEVGDKRGTAGYYLKSRAGAIGMSIASNASNTIGSYMQGGEQIRLANQQSIDGITLASAQRGQSEYTGRRADNKLSNRLGQISLDNGTGYDPTTMANFAGNFSQSTGSTTNVEGAADAMSKLSRFANMGEDTTNSIMSAVGQTGAAKSASQVSSINQTLAGAIQSNNLQAKAGQQGQAFATIMNNLQGLNVSNQSAQNIAAFQGMAAKGNSALQGQNGAEAYNKLTGGLDQLGKSDPMVRAAFMRTNPGKYVGPQGQAQADLDLGRLGEHPEQMMKVMQNMARTSPGGWTGVAAKIHNATGMRSDQAEEYAELAKSGNATKSKLEDIANKYKKSGKDSEKKGEKQYEVNGDSTLNIKVAIKANGEMQASQTMDTARSASNSVMKNAPGMSLTGDVVSGVVQGGINSLIGSITGNGISKIPGLGKIFKGSGKGGGFFKSMGNLFKGSGEAGTGGLFSTVATKAKNVASGAKTKASGVWTTAKVAGGSVLAKGVEKVKGVKLPKGVKIPKGTGKVMESITKGGSKLFGKGALKTAGKFGLKSTGKLGSKLIPGLGWGLAAVDAIQGVGDIAKDPMNALKHPIKSGLSILGLDRVNEDKPGIFDSGKKKSSKKDKKAESHEDKVLKEQKSLLKGFNDMLDKAEVVISEAKGININKDSDSSSDSGSGDVTEGGNADDNEKLSSPEAVAKKWTSRIKAAAKKMGQHIEGEKLNQLIHLIYNESNGDAGINGIDDGDGTGSAKGLLQYKESTFKNFAVKGHEDILNGDDQLLAFFNNSNWRSDIGVGYNGKYGEWRGNASGPSGHRINASGGMYSTPGMTKLSEGGQLEAVIPLGHGNEANAARLLDQSEGILGRRLQKKAGASQGGNVVNVKPSYNINISSNGNNDQDLIEKIKSVLADSVTQMQQQLSGDNLMNQFSQNINY